MIPPESSSNVADPPSPFRVFETASPDEFRHAIISVYGAERVEIGEAAHFEARGCVASLNEIELRYGTCSTSVAIDFPPIDCFRLALPLSGTGRISSPQSSVDLDARFACISPPDQPSRMEFGAPHGWLTLRVKPAALARRATALTGRRPRGRLEFAQSLDQQRPDARLLTGLTLLMANTLAAGPADNQSIIARLEDLMVHALLGMSRWDTDSDLPSPSAGNAAARQAAAYIDANCTERHVDLAELVALTHVSARSLSRAFVRIYGSSPIAYAKQRRLSRARDLLIGSSPGTTVTAVALRCGFANLSHFAKDYAVLFGELPSQTLAAARRR